MLGSSVDDPILKRFLAALAELYGDRLERVVLFGSRARGDAREDSDYDVAVFIKDPGAFWGEVDRLVDVETDLLYDTGAVINSMPYPAGAYQDRTSLMREIRTRASICDARGRGTLGQGARGFEQGTRLARCDALQ
jgi:predicted nucleotidyltransferase